MYKLNQTIRGVFYACFYLFMIIGCKSHPSKDVVQKALKLDSTSKSDHLVFNKPGSSFSDTLIVNHSAAIFYKADTKQLAEIKRITKPDVFQSRTHEYFFQMRNAKSVLKKEWPRLKIIETSSARFLLIQIKGRPNYLVDLNDYADYSGIVLCGEQKPPRQIDMMNVDTELYYYYR